MTSRKRKALAAVLALRLIDDLDIKTKKGMTSQWIKRRETHYYYQNIIIELSFEDLASFEEIMRTMSYADVLVILSHIEEDTKSLAGKDFFHGQRLPGLSP